MSLDVGMGGDSGLPSDTRDPKNGRRRLPGVGDLSSPTHPKVVPGEEQKTLKVGDTEVTADGSTVTIQSGGALIQVSGDSTGIKGSTVAISGTNALTLKGPSINIESTSDLNLNSNGKINLNGRGVSINGVGDSVNISGHGISMESESNLGMVAKGEAQVRTAGSFGVESAGDMHLMSSAAAQLHSAEDMEIIGGEQMNIKSVGTMDIESEGEFTVGAENNITLATHGVLTAHAKNQMSLLTGGKLYTQSTDETQITAGSDVKILAKGVGSFTAAGGDLYLDSTSGTVRINEGGPAASNFYGESRVLSPEMNISGPASQDKESLMEELLGTKKDAPEVGQDATDKDSADENALAENNPGSEKSGDDTAENQAGDTPVNDDDTGLEPAPDVNANEPLPESEYVQQPTLPEGVYDDADMIQRVRNGEQPTAVYMLTNNGGVEPGQVAKDLEALKEAGYQPVVIPASNNVSSGRKANAIGLYEAGQAGAIIVDENSLSYASDGFHHDTSTRRAIAETYLKNDGSIVVGTSNGNGLSTQAGKTVGYRPNVVNGFTTRRDYDASAGGKPGHEVSRRLDVAVPNLPKYSPIEGIATDSQGVGLTEYLGSEVYTGGPENNTIFAGPNTVVYPSTDGSAQTVPYNGGSYSVPSGAPAKGGLGTLIPGGGSTPSLPTIPSGGGPESTGTGIPSNYPQQTAPGTQSRVRADIPHVDPVTGKKTEAAVRYHNMGAAYPAKNDHLYGSLGYGVIGGGHLISRFPDNVTGAAANFDLMGRKYVNKTPYNFINTWTGSKPYKIPAGLAKYGGSTPAFFNDKPAMIDTIMSMHGSEAPRSPTLTRAEASMAYDMWKAGGLEAYKATNPTQYFEYLKSGAVSSDTYAAYPVVTSAPNTYSATAGASASTSGLRPYVGGASPSYSSNPSYGGAVPTGGSGLYGANPGGGLIQPLAIGNNNYRIPGYQGTDAAVKMVNQNSTRNLPITTTLAKKLGYAVAAVFGSGAVAYVYSGGQCPRGTCTRRIGSVRHDVGHAADLYVITANGGKVGVNGMYALGQWWIANNYGCAGVGMNVNGVAGGGIHLDEWGSSTGPALRGGMGRYWSYNGYSTTPLARGAAGTLPQGTSEGEAVSGTDQYQVYQNPAAKQEFTASRGLGTRAAFKGEC